MTDDDLKQAFRSPGSTPDPVDCPSPELFWELCQGELDQEQAESTLRHVAECDACGEALELARQSTAATELDPGYGVEQTSELPTHRPQARPRSYGRIMQAVVGIAAILVVGFVFLNGKDRSTRPAADFRGTPAATSWIKLGPQEAVSPSSVLLQWQALAGARDYRVELFTPDLDSLVVSEWISESEYRVAPTVLAPLQTETAFLWRVEARLANGDLERSPAFRTNLVSSDQR